MEQLNRLLGDARRIISGLLCGGLTFCLGLLGGWDAPLMLMFTAMGLDWCAGILTALCGKSDKTADGRFRSSAAFRGLTKKLLMLAVIALAVLVDRMTGTDGICRSAAIGFYAADEGMSILENARALGVPLPKFVGAALKKLRGE